MIPSKTRGFIRRMGYAFGSLRVLSLFYAFLIPLFLYIRFQLALKSAVFYHLPFSTADAFVAVSDPSFFALILVPMTLFFVCLLIRHDFALTAVLRGRHKARIFLRQVLTIALYLLAFILYTGAWTGVFAQFYCTGGVNWDQLASLFFLSTKQTTLQPLWRILLAFFISSFLSLLAANALLLLLRWTTDRYILSWILLLTVCVVDSKTEKGLFFFPSGVWYDNWASPWPIERVFLLPLVCLAAILILGVWYAKRKDFLHG